MYVDLTELSYGCVCVLVELAGAKFPSKFTMQGVQKIIKITKVY